jgi:hypothetical protein
MEPGAPPSVINLKSLGWSLLLLLAACLAAVAAIIGILRLGHQTELAYKQALALQTESRSRLARANEDQREIGEKIARYQEAVRLGRTQPERRLEWVETLRSIKESRRLLGLDYEISPQKPLDDKAVTASGGFTFMVSPMKLEMPLLHENDLLGLIADLSSRVQALISVKTCKIERIPATPNQSNAATLKASCEIDWITLQEKT